MKAVPSYRVRLGYLAVAVIALAGIVFQVLLVGLSLLGGQPSWGTHAGFGHMFGLLPLLLVILAYAGRLPGQDKRLAVAFIVVYLLQSEVFALVRDSVPFYAAWHPVLALVMFATSSLITWRGYDLVRTPVANQDTEIADLASDNESRKAA